MQEARNAAAKLTDAGVRTPWIQADEPTHAVRFYDADEVLFGVVAEFIAPALANGQSALIIATEAHRDGFLTHLARSHGVDTIGACLSGRLTLLDARVMLAAFMLDDRPDPARFGAAMASMIERSSDSSGHPVVCAYGEMVDLLYQDGNSGGAIQIEGLWNELAERYSFALLCAYAREHFCGASHAEPFHHICRQHSHVAGWVETSTH